MLEKEEMAQYLILLIKPSEKENLMVVMEVQVEISSYNHIKVFMISHISEENWFMETTAPTEVIIH